MSTDPRPRFGVELLLVVAIPLCALVGGYLTLRVAEGDLSADGATEGARRTAQVQDAELNPDLVAARTHLSGSLFLDPARGEVRVLLNDATAARQGLQLELVHALHAERDLHATLQPQAGGWTALLAPDAGSRWKIVLSDSQRRWRLVGTLERGETSLALRPALAAP
jgi:hypothetical protein